MTTNIIMPQLGESVVEGTLTRWLKREGDAVKAFEPLLEVSTDKVDTEVPSPADGILTQIVIAAGTTVAKGTVLGVINGELARIYPQEQPHPPTPSPLHGEGVLRRDSIERGWHVTPVVARMAAESSIDLAQIVGTGRGGRVTKKDVEGYLAARTPNAPAPDPWDIPVGGGLFKSAEDRAAERLPAPSRDAPAAAPAAAHIAVTPNRMAESPPLHAMERGLGGEVNDQIVPLSSMRRQIAEHMVRSKHTSPHVTTVFEIDMSAVNAHREQHKMAYAGQGVNLTFTAYVIAAVVEGLRAVPMLNAEWTDAGIRLHPGAHIGIAVALTDGLIVPVIKHAGDLNLLGLARAVNDLAGRARAKQLSADAVRGGTFTITNHGVTGSVFATPIINQPQVGILGVGMIEKRVKVVTDARGSDSIAIRPCCYMSLTFDHRIVDGATGDGFMQVVKRTLEGWA
jgi:2-oxoglutarate dehydrogenase E2 component (dihydrolipoamide succinyltransferase)